MQSPLTHQPCMLLARWLLASDINSMCLHEGEDAAPQADLSSITHLQTEGYYLRYMQCSHILGGFFAQEQPSRLTGCAPGLRVTLCFIPAV